MKRIGSLSQPVIQLAVILVLIIPVLFEKWIGWNRVMYGWLFKMVFGFLLLFGAYFLFRFKNTATQPDTSLEQKPIIPPWVIMLFLLIAISGILFSPNFSANWGLIDDHEVISFLGEDRQLTFAEIPHLLMTTEVGHPQDILRFRPVYYLLRLLECVFWGNQPVLWYSFRLVILIGFLMTCWAISKHWLGGLFAGLVSVYILSFPYWSDIVSRLGCSEIYAVLGLTMLSIGVFLHLKSQKPAAWLLVSLGGMLAAGSKENLLILVLPVTLLFLNDIRNRKMSLLQTLSFCLFLLFSFWILITVARITLHTGTDVYLRSVESSGLLTILIHGFTSLTFLILCLVALALLCFNQLNKKMGYEKSAIQGLLPWVLILLLVIYISQFTFYNGKWPTGSRYDFPGLLYLPILIILSITLIHRWFGNPLPRLSHFWSFFLLLGLLLLNMDSFIINYQRSLVNQQATVQFTERRQRVVSQLNSCSDCNLILESDNPGDYEATISWMKFLRADGIKNPVAVLWNGKLPGEYNKVLDQSLINQMINISTNGSADFTPLTSISSANRCLLVDISDGSISSCMVSLLH